MGNQPGRQESSSSPSAGMKRSVTDADLEDILEESMKDVESWVPVCSDCICCHGFCSQCECTGDKELKTSVCLKCSNKFEAPKTSGATGEFSSAFSLAFGGSASEAVPGRALDAAARAVHTQAPPLSSRPSSPPAASSDAPVATAENSTVDEFGWSVRVFPEVCSLKVTIAIPN
jgi:hypothetical protein